MFSFNFAQAQGFGLLGAEARFTEDSTREFELEVPMLIAGGYKADRWVFMGEALHYKDASKEGSLSIENKHLEITGYAAFFVDYEADRIMNPYVIAGLGAYKNFVEYDFAGTKRKDSSVWEPVVKLGGGVWSEVSKKFIVNFEGKGMYSKKLNPELTFEVTARFGLLF